MQTMAGTLMPEEQARILQQQQPLIDALRASGGALAFNPAATTPVQGSQGAQTMNNLGNVLGGALGQGGNWFKQNLATAKQYGTNPLSEQTNMLQAQDAAFL